MANRRHIVARRTGPRASRVGRWVAGLAIGLALIVGQVLAQVAVAAADEAGQGENLPRFATVGASKLNVREGPGQEYQVKFQYRRKGYPVKVVAEAQDAKGGNWSLIHDADGDEGWVSTQLLSKRRCLLVIGYGGTGAMVALRETPSKDGHILAALQPGVLLRLDRCEGEWCLGSEYPQRKKLDGWVHASHVWGAYLDER